MHGLSFNMNVDFFLRQNNEQLCTVPQVFPLLACAVCIVCFFLSIPKGKLMGKTVEKTGVKTCKSSRRVGAHVMFL